MLMAVCLVVMLIFLLKTQRFANFVLTLTHTLPVMHAVLNKKAASVWFVSQVCFSLLNY